MRYSLLALAACAAITAAGALPPLQTPDAGRIDRHYLYSPEMQDTITVDVWLPESYLANKESYLPVLYMHDGQNLFDAATTWNHQSWEMDSVVSRLNETGLIVAPVIVGIHSIPESRVADLMPQALFNDTVLLQEARNGKFLTTPLRGDAYAKFVSTTLRDMIEQQYRVLSGPENTFVMGSSMGGLMSAYMICEYPEIYGGAACLSTHWVGSVTDYAAGEERFPRAMYDYLAKHLPSPDSHKLYFDRGTETIDAYYDKWDDRVIALCNSLGYRHGVSLDSGVYPGAPHEESAWKQRVHRPLRFLLTPPQTFTLRPLHP